MRRFTHAPVDIQDIQAVTSADGSRVYLTPEGKRYPSVTTVLAQHTRAGIQEWRNRVGEAEANKISQQASSRGTRFHVMAEKYLNNDVFTGTPSLLDSEMFNMAKSELHHIDNIRAQEVALWSHHLRLAGRSDCIAEYKGHLSIIDFKTARREKDLDHVQHYFMQAAAYAIMFEERTTTPVSRLTLIIAVEDGVMQVFQGKRDDYVKQLLYYRDVYEATI